MMIVSPDYDNYVVSSMILESHPTDEYEYQSIQFYVKPFPILLLINVIYNVI